MEEIKSRCGEDFVVALRYSPKSFIKDWRVGALPGEEFEEKGRDIPEGIEAAKLLVKYGYDCLDVDVGSYDAWWWSHPPMYQKKGLYIEYAKLVKDAVDVPIICAGRMDDADMAAKAVEDGACDIVSLGRPLLADPDYVNKLKAGKVESIRPCLSCQEGCMGRIQEYSALNCAVNPACCRERIAQLLPTTTSKKVLIIGGGPAGCEAARVLAIRGHKPVLCEARDTLGGNLIPGGTPDFKEDDLALVRWYAHELKELDVEVRLNTKMTAEDIQKEEFGVLIRFGFMETPDVPLALMGSCDQCDLSFNPMDTTYFASRETIVARRGGGMPLWRDKLFALMHRNAAPATGFFRIPGNRLVELGAQVEI